MTNHYHTHRGAMLDNCCQCIRALSVKPMSARELSNEIGFSLKTAYRYIEGISLAFPVSSIETTVETGHKVEKFKIDTLT